MASVLYMSMSLDGFIAGPNEGPGNGLGDGGDRLHDWAFPDREVGLESTSGVNAEVVRGFMSTGSVLAGRQTFELAGGWNGDHHDGVPIFVYSRRPRDPEAPDWPLATYVTDIGTAMARAKEAAGEKDVLVHGAGTTQAALAAGLLDELHIHLIPVLLGEGRRLFEHLGADHIELEPLEVIEAPDVTHLRYRVRR